MNRQWECLEGVVDRKMRARWMHLRRLGLCPDRVGSETQPTSVAAGGCIGKWLAVFGIVMLLAASTIAQEPKPAGGRAASPEVIRELFVPFEDLEVLLEGDVRRVFLTRDEYQQLVNQARKTEPDAPAPHAALIVSAEYEVVIRGDRAAITGVLDLDVMADGLHAIPLDFQDVGLRSARLDDEPAPLARDEQGNVVLLVTDSGRVRLSVEMVTRLETSAAEQSLSFRVPAAPASRWRLSVPGNVDIKSGASVVSRQVDEDADVTRFQLLMPDAPAPLVMTLNNRLLQRQRVIVARSVVVDEITTAAERLHATVAMSVLHGAADRFRFAIPTGFEPTEVLCEMMARWEVREDQGRRQLEVELREPATGTVVLQLSATRTPARLTDWTLPQLQPLDVDGQVALVGVVVQQELQASRITPQGLIPVDHEVLAAALPDTFLRVDASAPQVRTVAAFYAPSRDYSLQADFVRAEPRLQATTHLLLTMNDTKLQVHGGMVVAPEVERLFEVRFQCPLGWHIRQVTDADGNVLPIERTKVAEGYQGIRVRLEPGVPPGEERTLLFQAQYVPPGWLGDWQETAIEFPRFVIQDAERDIGAIAVRAEGDLIVRPDQLEQLVPLGEREQARYGLGDVVADLAYRYDYQPYRATLIVGRDQPTITARSYSFLQLAPSGMTVHYELLYDIRQAHARRLSFVVPSETPTSLAIQALEGAEVKEYFSETTDAGRCWTAILARPAAGPVRLSVHFQVPLASEGQTDYRLPLPTVEDVEYQTAVVAVEGHADLDLDIETEARQIDIGELAAAQHRVGVRLLGVYEFAGPPGDVSLGIRRRDGYGLPIAIVQRAELETLTSVGGTSTTGARYLLRTKAPFLEIQLPDRQSRLWSALVDGRPMTPLADEDRLLIPLPATSHDEVRDLQIVYETSTARLFLSGSMQMAAPRLLLRAEREAPSREVPTADLQWRLHVPSSHQVVHSFGTVETRDLAPPVSPLRTLAAPFFSLGKLRPAQTIMPQAARETGVAVETAPMAAMRLEPEYDDAVDMDDPFGAPAVERPQRRRLDGDMPVPEPAEAPAPADQLLREPEEAPPAPPTQRKLWALDGVRSLQIEMQQEAQAVTFRSLGVDPRMAVTLVNRQQMKCLTWAVAGLVLAIGIGLTRASVRWRATFVLVVILVALTLPPITGAAYLLGDASAAAFFTACLLVLVYLLLAAVRWLGRCCDRCLAAFGGMARGSAVATTGRILLVAGLGMLPGRVMAQEGPPEFDPRPLVDLLLPPDPVDLPEDAVIVPYDPDQGDEGIRNATRVLVPYTTYQKLWNRAHPAKRLDTVPPVVPYALAGATYQATLGGGEFLELQGSWDIEVFSDQPVQIPLLLQHALITAARLDGQPAQLRIVSSASDSLGGDVPVSAEEEATRQTSPPSATRPAAPEPLVLLHVKGRGTKRLELTIRIPLERRGGWRVVSARIPAAPAASLTLQVPAAGTEVRLPDLADQTDFETDVDDARIETALPMTGDFHLQWRPRVAEGIVDRSLTVESEAVLDVQEDGLRLAWQLELLFPRSRRDSFTVLVPEGYLVERVIGDNVQGWQSGTQADRVRLEIVLLQEAVDRESITLHLSQRGAVRAEELTSVTVPAVVVDGASLQRGRITIRRSSLLDLRTERAEGLTRTEIGVDAAGLMGGDGAGEESPLGLRAYQAYQFAAVPYTLQLTASPIIDKTVAQIQTLLRIAERETTVETRVVMQVHRRPVHRVRMYLPQELELHDVGPTPLDWNETEDQGRRLLTIWLPSGQTESFSLVLSGSLGRRQATDPVAVPRFEVLDVSDQQGAIVVQIDPAFDVQAADLQNCEIVLLSTTFAWLDAAQRPLARLALRYHRPDYSGRLEVSPRPPRVSGITVTNVKVTNIAVEETIVIDLIVVDAGIREVVFLIPAAMQRPRIHAPRLRQKSIRAAENGWQRVRLELQDEMLGEYRVLIENDRLLTMADARQSQTQHAPIPVLETGRTDQRYVTLEEAGRDEVQIVDRQHLQPLSRQQAPWRRLASILGDGVTQAFLVSADAETPRLSFRTVQRSIVETVGAGIGLAETFLIVDAAGAYRGRQTYHVYNTIEQFLEIQLPHAGTAHPAELWTATVAGHPVKPAPVPDAELPGAVRIPLIKTAEGDPDYPVVLHYGGRLPPIRLLRGIEFPFLQTRNINVELSQVRLRLPESYRWLAFDGTMRRVTDEADLAADFFDYNTRQIKRLMQVWDTENPYARARVASNLKQLETMIDSPETSYRLSTSSLAQDKFAANVDALRLAQEQTQRYFDEKADAVELDNRARLNTFYSVQQPSWARNVVTEMDGNFQPSALPMVTRSDRQEAFRSDWLTRNQLDQRGRFSEEAIQRRFQAQTPGEPAIAGRRTLDRSRAVLQDSPAVPPQRLASPQAEGPPADRRPSSRVVDQTQLELARQYQQQLAADRESRSMEMPSDQDADYGMGYGDMYGADMYGRGMGGMGGGMLGAAESPHPGRPGAPGGLAGLEHLASLDVQLPERGVEVFFTTPRGEVQIVAYGIRQDRVSRITQVLMIALVAFIVYAGYRIWGTASATPRDRKRIPTGHTVPTRTGE